MAPSTPVELKDMLELAIKSGGPVAIRYPKGATEVERTVNLPVKTGKAEVLREGKDVAIIAIGIMAEAALEAADRLSQKKIDVLVVNARFIKPLDEELFASIFKNIKKVITIEDGVLDGGFGSAILELAEKLSINGLEVKRMGLPDKFIEHGKRQELLSKYGLTADGICDEIINKVVK